MIEVLIIIVAIAAVIAVIKCLPFVLEIVLLYMGKALKWGVIGCVLVAVVYGGYVYHIASTHAAAQSISQEVAHK